ncbi:hypothetical protein ACFL2A_06795, partial [Thermodesulfobacteriota bacterium]
EDDFSFGLKFGFGKYREKFSIFGRDFYYGNDFSLSRVKLTGEDKPARSDELDDERLFCFNINFYFSTFLYDLTVAPYISVSPGIYTLMNRENSDENEEDEFGMMYSVGTAYYPFEDYQRAGFDFSVNYHNVMGRGLDFYEYRLGIVIN